ncbi:hypothetical protein CCMSSC00406_0004301 [Pleurotus cornucopiae]|nr:hypothetical protein CCMSSC00406_0004301 [Pleurotus cornucopiae]
MNRLTSGIFEIFLVLVTAASFNLVMTPPHAAVPKDQLAKQTLTDKTARQQALLQRVIFVGSVSLLHVATLVASFGSAEGHATHTIPNMFIVATAICLACAIPGFH